MKLVDSMDFEAVFNSLPTPTMVMDADLNIVAANTAYLDVTGRDIASLIGANVFAAFPGEGQNRAKLQKSFERVRDEGVADVLPSLDYPIAGASGVEARRWSCTHVPIRGPDGKVAYIVQNTQDISALALSAGAQAGSGGTGAPSAQPLEMVQVLNQTLLTTAHYLHRLFMQASNFMCVLRGRDYVYEMINKAYAEFIGGRDVVGQRMRDAMPELASQGFMDVLDKVFNSGEAFAGRKMRVLLQGGDGQIREYFIDLTCQPILGEDGAVSGIFIEGSDVTNIVRAEQRQALLIRELHHRVRNTLATVQGVMNTTAKSTASIEEFQEAFAGRIGSLAKTHAVMTDEFDQCVSFEHLLNQELGIYAGNGLNRVHLSGPPVELPSQIAVPLGMAVHELTTNAAKFGSLAFEAGHVAVEWSLDDGPSGAALRWEWSETDGPRVAPPGREGFGSMLLKRVLSQQIGAEVNVAYEPEGFRLRMLVPLRAER
ncbi:sensor histidine kinase [Methylocella silvestris]|uniref:Blue-light-activated histidine kinase n=1 Tax=Methylocella silvestris TaxID=199596 RepID=A0A2J7TJX3_METSI|nr:PAS domain-containing sensor histidine kinase [Methylocella silvestris]PNG27063.1 histidine kinase [Methylocella silvestris]